jgi:Complex 1 protein (LYR family)
VEALKLYRHNLKSLAFLPKSHSTIFKRKLQYNFREIFEIHREEKDEIRIKSLIANGWADLETMRELFRLDPSIVSKLFPLFDLKPSEE